MKKIFLFGFFVIVLLISVCCNPPANVEPNDKFDKNEEPVQLKGMSSHGLQWYSEYMNQDSISWMVT